MIYLIRCTGTGLIKIGHAIDADARRADLQIGSASALELVLVAPGGKREEASLHRHFADRRVRGEWFALTREDLGVQPGASAVVRGCLRAPRNPKRGDPWTVKVTCPFCGCPHFHGAGRNGMDAGVRVAHCGGGPYSIATVDVSIPPWSTLARPVARCASEVTS